MTARWTARPATGADVEPIARLRATVLRPDLERLGRYDDHRVRQRLRDAYTPHHTTIILVGGAFAGCVAVRPAGQDRWLEHFYLDPALQGQGIGTAVLRTLLHHADTDGVPVRLNVLQGSAAQRLYERHGFTVQTQDPVDVYMLRPPAAPSGSGPSSSSDAFSPPAASGGPGGPSGSGPVSRSGAVSGPDGAGVASTTDGPGRRTAAAAAPPPAT
jgi:GNAT superfamily N-acetyltransferase